MGPRTERFSMAREIADAHGVVDAPAVFDGTFVTADGTQPLPFPPGDSYLGFIGLTVSEKGGATISLQTPPGYIDHLQEVGVLPTDTRLVQRPARIIHPGKMGYPATTPLAQLASEGYRFHDDGNSPYLTSIYESPEIRRTAEAVGLKLLGRPDSNVTNNKARLREHAAEFGIDMLPGQVVYTWDDLGHFAERHKGERSWMKVATGSGGDLVLRVDHTSREKVVDAISSMQRAVAESFNNAEFAMTMEEFWPEGDVSPIGFPNIIEEDASVEGEIVVNGSNFFVVNADGSVDYHGTFKQLTDPETGEFMGSVVYDPKPDVLEKIQDQTMRLANYAKSMKYRGPIGMDFFEMVDALGRTRIRPIEGNFRPPISSNLWVVRENLVTEFDGEYNRDGIWINRNHTSRIAYGLGNTIPDVIGRDLAFGIRDQSGKVLRQLIPLATRALVTENSDGEVSIMPSDKAKWVVYAANQDQVNILNEELRVIFSS